MNACYRQLLRLTFAEIRSEAFLSKDIKIYQIWIFQLHRVAGSIFDNVIRKLMTPGKVFLYILKVL